ncbi:MAG: hypothetical protein ACRCUY_05990 [Thermoguttaceae bacterium]
MGIKLSRENLKPARRGVILFVVSIIIAMLSVGSLALLSLISTEHEATLLRGDEMQAAQLVQSGIEYIAAQLEISKKATQNLDSAQILFVPDSMSNSMMPNSTMSGELIELAQNGENYSAGFFSGDDASQKNRFYDNPNQFRGIEVVPTSLGRHRRGAGRFTIFSPRIENERQNGIRFGLVNESTRLNIGAVLEWEIESPGQGVRALMKLPGMTPTIADSILDWIDSDKMARASGAEREFYEQIGVPYLPRNAVPATLEELLLVRDMTRPLLLGNDISFSYGAKRSDLEKIQTEIDIQTDLLFGNQNSTISDEFVASSTVTSEYEQEAASLLIGESPLSGEPILPWCFLLTTLSAEKLVNPNGEPKFYLNDDNLEFLETQLRSFLDEDAVQFILTWRRESGKIDDVCDLLDATITPSKITPSEKNESDKTNEAGKTIEADKTIEPIKSPFSLDHSSGETKFLRLLDEATTESSIVVSGRININSASRFVLEAIPELTPRMVRQILARRGDLGEEKAGRFRHPVWILAEGIVDSATMKKLSKRLTCGGDVFRAQIVGFFDAQGTTSRAEVVIDATVLPPRQIFSKDLTMFGSGFE